MEILTPEEMAARQGALPVSATPQPPVPGSFIKRFAVPIVVAGAVALAAAAFLFIPRTELPEASAPAAESAPVTTVSSLSPETQRACHTIYDRVFFGTPAELAQSLVYIHLDIEAAPENYDPYFKNLVNRMIESGIYNTDSTALAAEVNDYCNA